MTFDQVVAEIMQRTGCPRARAEAIARANPHAYDRPAEPWSTSAPPAAPRPRMNGLETRRAAELEALLRAGEIRSWRFEALKLILADRTTYTPDFLVELNDRALVIEETKGFWRDDARVKIKVAARLFPMLRFVALTPRRQRDGGGWNREEFRP